MMRKVLSTVVALSFVVAILGALPALGQEAKCEMDKAKCEKVAATCGKGAMLTEEQKAKIGELRLAIREKNIDLRAKLEKLRLEMKKELDAAEPNAATLGRIIDEMSVARAAMQKNGIELALSMRKILTPEQRAMMKEKGGCCPGGEMMECMSPGGGKACAMMGGPGSRMGGPGKAPHWWIRGHRRPMGRVGHPASGCGAMMMGPGMKCGARAGCMKGHEGCMMGAEKCKKGHEGCMKGGKGCMMGAEGCKKAGEGCMKGKTEASCSKEKDAEGARKTKRWRR